MKLVYITERNDQISQSRLKWQDVDENKHKRSYKADKFSLLNLISLIKIYFDKRKKVQNLKTLLPMFARL